MAYIASGENEIFYERRGSGPPLLLINGFGPPCEWIEQFYLPHFLPHFECAWFDLRGVGRSSALKDNSSYRLSDHAEDVAAVMDALGWKTAHIWGASFGAALALQFACAFPGRARSLAIAAADPGTPDIFQKSYADVYNARRAYFGGLARQAETPAEAAEEMIKAYFPEGQRRTDPRVNDVRHALIKMLTERPIETLMSPFKDIAEMTTPSSDLPETATPSGSGGTGAVWSELDALKSVNTPVLLLQGYSDLLVHRDAALYLTNELSNIEMRLVKPAAHSFAISDEHLEGMARWIMRRENEAASASALHLKAAASFG
ncbi:MAG: alpha/beta fold hydrolase [Pseudomonadota bacterium]